MSKSIPNVPVPCVEVPDGFPALAQSFGYTARDFLWVLAADFCTNPPRSISVVTQKAKRAKRLPVNVVPFPGRTEVA